MRSWNFAVVPLAMWMLGACAPLAGTDAGPDVEAEAGPWQMPFSGQRGALLSVTGTAADDVWIVGADRRDGTGPLVWHYDGAGFREHRTGDEGDLWWVAIAPDGDVWMAGEEGRTFRFERASARFSAMQAPDSTRLYGILPFADDDVWAVGGDDRGGTGVIWHYDGQAWSRPSDLPAGLIDDLVLFKVWGKNPNDVWMVGQGGAAIHYQGAGAWTRVALPLNRPIFTVHGAGDVMLAVGGVVDGLLLEEREGSLIDVTPADAPQLIGVHVNGDGSAVAAGYEGALWERTAAGTWRALAGVPGTFHSYHAVYRDPTGGIWAVGGSLDFEPLQQGMLTHYGDPLVTDVHVEPSGQ